VHYLVHLRKFYMTQRQEGKDHKRVVKEMTANMYTSGLLYFNISGLY